MRFYWWLYFQPGVSKITLYGVEVLALHQENQGGAGWRLQVSGKHFELTLQSCISVNLHGNYQGFKRTPFKSHLVARLVQPGRHDDGSNRHRTSDQSSWRHSLKVRKVYAWIQSTRVTKPNPLQCGKHMLKEKMFPFKFTGEERKVESAFNWGQDKF